LFDGMFIDEFSSDIAWTSNDGDPNARHLDYARAGFTSGAQMDSARRANFTRMVSRVRAAGGAGFIMSGNGTTPTSLQAQFDGWMWEGMPDHFGQGFAGALADYRNSGPYSWIQEEGGFSETGGPYTPTACSQARFSLATACMGNGWGC